MTSLSNLIARSALALAVSAVVALPGAGQAQGLAGPYLAAQQAESRGDVVAAARFYTKALARDGDNATLLERAMMNQIAAGNVTDGIALARRLEDLNPGHHLGVLALAAGGLSTGDANAVSELLNAEGPFVGQVIDAWATYGAGDQEGALAILTELEAADDNGQPGQIVAAYHYGLISAASGDDEGAVEAMARVAEMANGGTLRLARLRAGSLARLGRRDEAVAVINERLSGTFGNAALSQLAAEIEAGGTPAVEVDEPTEGAAEVLYGVSGLLARGRNRVIALAYSRLATHLDPALTEAQLLIAQILDQDRQYEAAISAYDAIPDSAPEALSAQVGMAEAMQAAGRPDEAIDELTTTVAKFPKQIEAHTALGDMLRRESRFEEASTAYDGAVALLPEIEEHHWVLFYQRGIANERSKQWDKAEADFKQALKLKEDQPDVLNYLGYSWVEQGSNLAEAEQMIERAVEQRPEDGYIVDSLGWVLYRLGDFDRAVEHLETAVELRPVDPVINDHFGDALWMVGRKIEARFQWKRALSFEPEEKDADRIRRKLEDGLDTVLAEEEAEGLPGIIGRNNTQDGGTDAKNDGG
jgi:tetratricopeptide (TPR) repeat protein